MVGLFIGTFYCFALPIGSVPDEPMHFWRVYELSEGKLMKDENGNIYGPETLKQAIDVYYNGKAGYTNEFINMGISSEGSDIVPINGTADTYMPFNYVPQVVGVWIGRLLQLPFIPMMYISRLLNMIFCVVIIYFCIKYIPILKKVVFLVGLFPMVMQQFASVSADGSIICAGIALITYVLYARKSMKRQITFWDFLLLLITCLVLTITKPVYVFLCLIVFWIPKKSFKNSMVRKLVFIGCLGGLVLAMTLVKMILLPADGGRFGAAQSQIAFIIHDPVGFLKIAFMNIVDSVVSQIGGIIGLELEAFTVNIYIPYVLVLFIIFVLLCAERNNMISSGLRIFFFCTTIVTTVAIYASLFAIYSVPGLDIIEGVQGRYFLPFLLLIPMMFLPSEGSEGAGEVRQRTLIKSSSLYIITTLICTYAGVIIFCTHMG